MKKFIFLTATLFMIFSNHAFSLTTTFTDQSSFLNNTGAQLFSIDFNSITNPLVSNGIFPGQIDFGSPEAFNPDSVLFNSDAMTDAGSTTSSNAVGPIDGIFLTSTPVYGFSLDFLSSGNPQTISIFDLGGSIIDAVLTPAGGFFGLVSDTPIASLFIANGEFSPGSRDRFFIDNFSAYAPVPIPATIWLFVSALLGYLGMVRKRQPL